MQFWQEYLKSLEIICFKYLFIKRPIWWQVKNGLGGRGSEERLEGKPVRHSELTL